MGIWGVIYCIMEWIIIDVSQTSKNNTILPIYIYMYAILLLSGYAHPFSFLQLYFLSLMSGKLNKEQQVQVVIRLKPVPKQQHQARSVYVSEEQEKTLVVETPNKKEYFVFDNIADDECSQQEIYEHIGQDAVKSSTDGYNCCIFAYGQTGAGKTYSILGNSQDIFTDYYAESRGILPRLLSDLFSWCSNETDRFWIKCSYLEIYNEQIIDLLNPELRLRQMREDFKKGVYVEGLSQENATNYEQAMSILLRGVKNRKTSATSMNDQSSRSHTIFTLNIESEFLKEDTTTIRRSKINIVDLAGSERAKQTKVEGDRLREGCNINRSLHVLGNVINALVESSKKKKHIPFRDSKLTHFLKDSLCGNSITKLLANIHPSKAYLGDTLSTLMFAKRAKILKMKVQVNENMTQNFEQLRKQIRKLREQLAQARYIKHEQKVQRNISESQNDVGGVLNTEKIDASNFDMSKNEHILQIFQDNQVNYRALIQVYEEHLKICTMHAKNRKSMNMHQEWKNLEKKNQSYRNIVKNVPAFTKIFKQNIKLKAQQSKPLTLQKQSLKTFKQLDPLHISILKPNSNPNDSIAISPSDPTLASLKSSYELLLKEIQQKFTSYIEQLESAFEQLENENRCNMERIRDLRKRKELPPDLEELANENQYLKLNILELEDEIGCFEEKERKLMIEIKELKKEREREREREKQNAEDGMLDEQTTHMMPRLLDIKSCLQKQVKEFQEQRNSILAYIDKLKQHLITQIEQNKTLTQNLQTLKAQNKGFKKKLNSLLKINNQVQISKDHNTYTNTFWTNQESNFSEELEIFNDKNKNNNGNNMAPDKEKEKEDQVRLQQEEERNRGTELSGQIIRLHKSYGEEIGKLREEIKSLEKARRDLAQQNYHISNRLRQLECESESSYLVRQKQAKRLGSEQPVQEKLLAHVRSTKTLQKLKDQKLIGPQKEKGDSLLGSYAIPTIKSKNVLQIREDKQEKAKKSFG